MVSYRSETAAYIIGIALGDGNLSNPNGRATRLRITCDARYPDIACTIEESLSILFPNNKISRVPGPKKSYFNISIYSNQLDAIMPWQANQGTKYKQAAHVPEWIFKNTGYSKACLKGLIQSDGSIYRDRGYYMINFTNDIRLLASDVQHLFQKLGYKPHLYCAKQKSGRPKYTVRLSRNVEKFLSDTQLRKT